MHLKKACVCMHACVQTYQQISSWIRTYLHAYAVHNAERNVIFFLRVLIEGFTTVFSAYMIHACGKQFQDSAAMVIHTCIYIYIYIYNIMHECGKQGQRKVTAEPTRVEQEIRKCPIYSFGAANSGSLQTHHLSNESERFYSCV
jgi:hypothetical protein